MRFWGGLSTFVLAFAAMVAQPEAAPLQLRQILAPSRNAAAIVPVVVFGNDARRLPQDFAAEHALDAAAITRGHAASGLIQCGNAHGAGQLTLSDDVITTAAHVFFDENGLPRSRSCTFDVLLDGRALQMPIDIGSIVAGSTNPYNVRPADDWAVARLVRPMVGVRPYGIAGDIHEEEPITFVARGHIDWGEAKKLSMQDCLLHKQLSSSPEGTREFSFDCDTGDGASGGALMFDRDYTRIGAILVGWRSNKPFSAVPFSRTHYNFAVSLEGAFRQAVFAAAGKMLVQNVAR